MFCVLVVGCRRQSYLDFSPVPLSAFKLTVFFSLLIDPRVFVWGNWAGCRSFVFASVYLHIKAKRAVSLNGTGTADAAVGGGVSEFRSADVLVGHACGCVRCS